MQFWGTGNMYIGNQDFDYGEQSDHFKGIGIPTL